MSNPFLGQVCLFAGNFAPRGWAFCAGQLLPISQNDALYALIGTTFGGDGVTTFAVPDLRGRVPIGQGTGPGLSNRTLGVPVGTETVTLVENQIPPHQHTLQAFTADATSPDPNGKGLAKAGLANPAVPANGNSLFYLSTAGITPNVAALPADTLQNSGGSQPHDNMAPSLVVNFIIALEGVFPSRN